MKLLNQLHAPEVVLLLSLLVGIWKEQAKALRTHSFAVPRENGFDSSVSGADALAPADLAATIGSMSGVADPDGLCVSRISSSSDDLPLS